MPTRSSIVFLPPTEIVTDPLWPEGYFRARAKTISNASICQAALKQKINRFILTKPLDAKTWPAVDPDNTYIGSIDHVITNSGKPRDRQIACKTLAHAVKALIGVGKIVNGYSTALTWTKSFLGQVDLPNLEVGRLPIFDLAPCDMTLPEDLHMAEALVGYSFRKKCLLIEALTHSSDFTTGQYRSYDRLAFLGNAIIESIVSDTMYNTHKAKSSSPCGTMSLYRAAVVNRYFLGYVSLD